MNINQRLKPNLVDPKYKAKISRTLNPPQNDYWKPTKNVAQTIWADYIRPNVWFFVFLVFVLVLLLYRYRTIQNQRMEESFITEPKPEINLDEKLLDYSDVALDIYHHQKECAVEPKTNTNSKKSRVKWATPANEQGQWGQQTQQAQLAPPNPKIAYPMFGYSKGGTLIPPSHR
jgi:hypothetical protein